MLYTSHKDAKDYESLVGSIRARRRRRKETQGRGLRGSGVDCIRSRFENAGVRKVMSISLTFVCTEFRFPIATIPLAEDLQPTLRAYVAHQTVDQKRSRSVAPNEYSRMVWQTETISGPKLRRMRSERRLPIRGRLRDSREGPALGLKSVERGRALSSRIKGHQWPSSARHSSRRGSPLKTEVKSRSESRGRVCSLIGF